MKNDGLEAPSAKTGWKPILRQFFGALGAGDSVNRPYLRAANGALSGNVSVAMSWTYRLGLIPKRRAKAR